MNENFTIKRASRLAIAAATLAIATVLAVGAAPAHAINDTLCSPGPTPSIVIEDDQTGENLGSLSFRVVMSNKACHYVKVHWATKAKAPGPGSATPAVDYTTSSGVIVIAPGNTQGLASIPVAADGKAEPAEKFLVKLTNPQGATVSDGTGVMTILDAVGQ